MDVGPVVLRLGLVGTWSLLFVLLVCVSWWGWRLLRLDRLVIAPSPKIPTRRYYFLFLTTLKISLNIASECYRWKNSNR